MRFMLSHIRADSTTGQVEWLGPPEAEHTAFQIGGRTFYARTVEWTAGQMAEYLRSLGPGASLRIGWMAAGYDMPFIEVNVAHPPLAKICQTNHAS